jgi:dihydropteroate synthase
MDKIVATAMEMASDGASILDIGGMSSRPGAPEIPVDEEIRRVVPAILAIRQRLPDMVISLDTYRSEVARKGIEAGANMINDISGGTFDVELPVLAAEHHLPYILMHMRGTPVDMHLYTDYQDIMMDLVKYFVERVRVLRKCGITDIILDPGFGFSKTMSQNYEIIRNLNLLSFFSKPVMIGVSRKSSLSKAIGRLAEDTLQATTALHMAALLNGASILRVHDVRPAMDTIAVFRQLRGVENP